MNAHSTRIEKKERHHAKLPANLARPRTGLQVIGRAPLKDPVALRLRNFTLTLRNNEADYIQVEKLEEENV